MIVSGMVKSSLVDYPGLVACVLFVPGCNYNCFYCHNRALIDGSHQVMNKNEIEHFLKKRAGLLDAVVISGGEPTLQSGLIDDIKRIKEYGFKIKLDTNGSSPRVVSEILQADLCDYFAVDYKAPASRYQEICGENADARPVLTTIHMLLDHKANFEVRTTVIPQLAKQDILLMAKELPLLPRYVLNRYKAPEKFLPVDQARIEEQPYTQTEIEELTRYISSVQPHVTT